MATKPPKGTACTSCGENNATKVLEIRRGGTDLGSYQVRTCAGCTATYQETFGEEVRTV